MTAEVMKVQVVPVVVFVIGILAVIFLIGLVEVVCFRWRSGSRKKKEE